MYAKSKDIKAVYEAIARKIERNVAQILANEFDVPIESGHVVEISRRGRWVYFLVDWGFGDYRAAARAQIRTDREPGDPRSQGQIMTVVVSDESHLYQESYPIHDLEGLQLERMIELIAMEIVTGMDHIG